MADTINPDLMQILVCPVSHARLTQVGNWLYSQDAKTRRRYPVRDGIPVMLIDESEVVGEEEYRKVMQDVQRQT